MKQLFYAFILLLLNSIAYSQNGAQGIYNEGIKAYEAQNYKQYLSLMRETDEIVPNQAPIMIHLSRAYALNGRKSRSVQQLCELILLDASYDFMNDADLESIKAYKGYREIVNMQKLALVPEVNDELFITIQVDSSHF